MTARLEGKVAVVAGGGGVGEAMCVRLATEGAQVAVLDVAEETATRIADRVGGISVQADVSESTAVEAALAAVEAELGPVDVWDQHRVAVRAQRMRRLSALLGCEGRDPSASRARSRRSSRSRECA